MIGDVGYANVNLVGGVDGIVIVGLFISRSPLLAH
jgi:hypothetical protein